MARCWRATPNRSTPGGGSRRSMRSARLRLWLDQRVQRPEAGQTQRPGQPAQARGDGGMNLPGSCDIVTAAITITRQFRQPGPQAHIQPVGPAPPPTLQADQSVAWRERAAVVKVFPQTPVPPFPGGSQAAGLPRHAVQPDESTRSPTQLTPGRQQTAGAMIGVRRGLLCCQP